MKIMLRKINMRKLFLGLVSLVLVGTATTFSQILGGGGGGGGIINTTNINLISTNTIVAGWTNSDSTNFTYNRVGIGTNNPHAALHVNGSSVFGGTIAAGQTTMDAESPYFFTKAITQDATNNVYSLRGNMEILGANNPFRYGSVLGYSVPKSNASVVVGVYGAVDNQGNGVVTNAMPGYFIFANRTNGTVLSANGVYINADNMAAGKVGAFYAFRSVPANSGTGFWTNYYGLKLEAPPTTIGPSFQIHESGGTNYFGSYSGFGISSPLERVHIVGNLRMQGNLIFPITATLGRLSGPQITFTTSNITTDLPKFHIGSTNMTNGFSVTALDFGLADANVSAREIQLRASTFNRGAHGFSIWDTAAASNNERLTMTAAGNFGLGITNPAAALHVAGSILASNAFSMIPGPVGPAGITNGLASFWNSNGFVYLRYSVPNYTTNCDKPLFP